MVCAGALGQGPGCIFTWVAVLLLNWVSMRALLPLGFILCLTSSLCSQVPVLQGYPFAKGGYFQAVEEDGVLYCTTDFGVAIWNVADPAAPILLSRYMMTGAYRDGELRKIGNTLLLRKRGKVHAVNVSNPAAPTGFELNLGGSTQVTSMEVRDSMLYAGTGNNIITYSVADLAGPVALDTVSVGWGVALSRTGAVLLVATQNFLVRADISTGLPILLDTIPAQDGLMVIDAMMAGNRVALLEGDVMEGFSQVEIYNAAAPGAPELQEVINVDALALDLLAMDDSMLIVQAGQPWVYDISVQGGAVPAGTLPGTLESHESACLGGERMYTMDASFGYSVFQRTGPAAFTVAAEHNVGDFIGEMKASSTGFVVAEGQDSLYVLDPDAPGTGLGIRDSRLYDAEDWWVFGDLLVEFRMTPPAYYELTILRIELDGSLNFQATLLPVHNGNTERLAIWDDVLYWSGYMSTVTVTDRYNLEDPAAPVFMDSTTAEYNAQWDGVLYTFWNEQGEADLYDPESSPPEWLATKAFSLGCAGFQAGYVYQDPQRAVLHQVSNSCYAAVDFQDTASVASYGPFPISEPIGPMGDGTGVWNKVLYIPGLNTQKIFLYDVCESGYFSYLATLPLRNFPRDLAFVDSSMSVAFGGYLEAYDVSNVLPCLDLNVASRNTPVALTVHPNPANNYFILDPVGFETPLVWEVWDAMGRLVQSAGQHQVLAGIRIACSDLAPGLYTVRVRGGGKAAMAKVVLE